MLSHLLAGVSLPAPLAADALPGAVAAAAAAPAPAPVAAAATAALPAISAGDTAFVLIAAAMVLLMTPGLGLFYGGMVRKKNVLSTLMHSFLMLGVVSVVWVVAGYSLAFSEGGIFHNLVGDLSFGLLKGVGGDANQDMAPTIPHLVFMAFQMMFAIITVALISGAIAERVKFSAFLAFAVLWSLFVYSPVCRWVWGPHGFLKDMGALDFAGGTVVHILSGFSALTAAILLGKRKGLGEQNMLPHNTTMVMTGAGLLWFGWFGFNAGSALQANGLAAYAFVNTNTAAAAAMLTWIAAEWFMHGKPTALGAASGCVAGLVAITPAAGFVTPAGALLLGALVSPICVYAVNLKNRFGYDDSLDAFGVHGVGGTFGALATGILATKAVNAAGADGGLAQLKIQATAVACSIGYAVVGTIVIFKVVDLLIGFRVTKRDEELGLDLTQHSEAGYEI
jgi:Amt family ammonium transporter